MRYLIYLISVAVLIELVVIAASAESLNNSATAAGELYWPTAEDEADLATREADGGFSSLEGMLQWAIGHSDPAKLKETAKGVHPSSAQELKERQTELKELMEKIKIPSDTQLMQVAINELNNSSLPSEGHQRALQELLILVEPIDNAIDLHKLGGLTSIIRELNHPDPEVRTLSAWVLGKASQNNPILQRQVLELGALARLMNMVKSNSTEEAIKALYAVSSLIRNNSEGQELFYREAGELLLQNIVCNSSSDIRLQRKTLFLVADLVECQLERENDSELPLFSNNLFLKSVVDLTVTNDLDLQEKALYAIKHLLQLRRTEALIFKDFCKLEVALERMRQQLLHLMAEENIKDYAVDVEHLRKEVELVYLQKLSKVQVPI